MLALVTKNISDCYEVYDGNTIFKARPRGRLKKSDKLFVGDKVDCVLIDNEWVIERRLSRKNIFERPSIANIEQLCILVSEVPITDGLLVDKLIIKCEQNNIEPILVINKNDVNSKEFILRIQDEYKHYKIMNISALTSDGVKDLKKLLKNKITALAGQSAVGKSKLSACLGADAVDGIISEKSQRGKHTTRHTQIYVLGDILLADTPGFSRLTINDIHYNDLKFFYPEFKNNQCKYPSCTHIEQKNCDCSIKMGVNDCKINQNRYNRYIQLYKELKQYWETRYD